MASRGIAEQKRSIQGYLTYKKTHPPRTLPQAYAWGPRGILGGGRFLMSEVEGPEEDADAVQDVEPVNLTRGRV